MDGFKKRLRNSIQFRLSWGLSGAIAVMALATGIFSFHDAFNKAHELQDDILRQTAALVQMDLNGKHGHDSDPESNIIIQPLGVQSENDAARGLSLPPTLADGLHTLTINDVSYRVLVKTISNGHHMAVSQKTKVRDKIAHENALRTIMHLLILIPILSLTVIFIIRKTLRPLTILADEISRRSEQDLHPIEEARIPSEVKPFIVEINRLLARVGQSMEAQRRFVADAAHELRSPLTALSLQAQRLEKAEMSNSAQEKLEALRQGIERGRVLLDQLLTLARAQSSTAPPTSPVSVQDIYRHILEDLMPLAEAKHMDIGVVGDQDVAVWVNELDLIALIRNLVDNAIRYTPEGGQVDLSIRLVEGCAVLGVQDTGPGIPLEERDRIFAPFYRVLGSDQAGSGLGLSIVQTITERIGGKIRLECSDKTAQTGLRVTVHIPNATLARKGHS